MRLLVSNDDGIDSPAIVPLVRALAALDAVAEVHCVVPDRQRSWIGAGITRFDPIDVARHERDGIVLHACSGTPADAVNVGLHALELSASGAFDMVVSGINIGLNQGDAFITSSGTIGAAAEAVASGLPAVAASLGPQPTDPQWQARLLDPARASQWEAAAAVVADVVAHALGHGLPHGADLLSVNMPEGTTPETPRRVTGVARTAYDQLFHPVDPGPVDEGRARFQAEFGGLRERHPAPSADVPSDFGALAEGCVAITPLRLAHGIDASRDWIARLEASRG